MLLATLAIAFQSADPLLAWMDRQAQQQLDQRARTLTAIQTREEAKRYRATVRAKLTELLGGLPTYRGPLRARVTGQLRAPTHIIEKVIFESLPGIYVTGNLYRPHAAGRYPAVLVPAGHTQEGKAEPQRVAANLAAQGFIALTYDPIGQGEREQHYLPQLGRTLSGGGGNEHLELGARGILIGQSVARYFIHDARRAVDYLVSRADVDADRLGVTGCSGGGAITTYVGVFDERMKAAAPGCFINSFRTLFTGPTADSEMSFPRFLASGLDMADFFMAAAPLPWLMMATTEDYFPPAGARAVYEEAWRLYGLLGAEKRIRFFVGRGPHGTLEDSRREIYTWMSLWLKNGVGRTQDLDVKLFSNLELRVTVSGNVDGETGSRKMYEAIADEYRTRRSPRRAAGELRAELRKWGVDAAGGPAPSVTARPSASHAAFRIDELQFDSEPGVPVRARLYVPAAAYGGPARRPAALVLEERRLPVPLFVQRSQATAAVCEALARVGHIVLEFLPRDSPDAYEGRPFLGNWVTNERADLIGRNLPALRAFDVRRAIDVLAARPDVDPSSIRGYARGVKGIWMLMAAAVDPRLTRIWLDRTPTSFEAALAAPLTNHLFDALIPGFALHWEITDLVEAVGRTRVFWTDPTDWMNRVVPLPDGAYRYRIVGESDAPLLEEFLR